MHSKILVADGERALLTTAAFMDGSATRRELSFAYEGAPARDLEAWTSASMRGDQPGMRAAAAQLEQHDIYVNDPLNGGSPKQQRRLQKRVLQMVDRAESEILIATKSRDEKSTFAKAIAAKNVERAAQGLPPITLRVIDQNSGARSAGVHGTVVVVDGREGYAGTAFLEKKAMDGKKDGSGRQSREIGVVTRDPATVAEMTAAWNGFNGVRQQELANLQAAMPGQGAAMQAQPQPFLQAVANVHAPEGAKQRNKRGAFNWFGRN